MDRPDGTTTIAHCLSLLRYNAEQAAGHQENAIADDLLSVYGHLHTIAARHGLTIEDDRDAIEIPPVSNSVILTTDGTLVDVYRRTDESFTIHVTPPGAPRTLAYVETVSVSADAAAQLVRVLTEMGLPRLPEARLGPALDLTTGETIGAER